MSDQSDSLPQKQTWDYAHTSAKAALSLIPVAGGAAAELFALLLAPPLERRRDAWLEDLYKRLRRLEEQVDDLHIEDLQHNEAFVSAAMQATRAAIATHQQDKREYLRNALVNTALSRYPEEDQIQMFLRYIEELTIWHVRFLQVFQAPNEFLLSKGTRFNVPGGFSSHPSVFNYTAGSPSIVLEMAFPELKGKRDFYNQIAHDLEARGMLNSTADILHTTMSAQGMLAKRTTSTADAFLEFIRDPLPG